MSKVLVAGYGSAGQYLVDFLLKDHRLTNLEELHIMSRKSKDEVSPRIKISEIAAGISNVFTPIIYHQADFNDIKKMTEIIQEIKPDVIVYTGRYAAGRKYGAYSYPNDIGYGVWLPLAFPYIYNLMKAVRNSDIDTKVINTSFPDGTNYLLKQVNLAPYCGAGNLNHLVPRIVRAVSKIYKLNPNDIDVDLIGSHFLNTYVSKEGNTRDCPYYLYITRDHGEYVVADSTYDKNETDKILKECKDNSAGGHIRNQMIATDCAEIVRLLVSDKWTYNESIHVPGLGGLPGGCKVFTRKYNEFDAGPLVKQATVREINIEGLRLDGVIIRDGGVEFTEEVRKKMKDIFNIEYPEFIKAEDLQEFADTIVKGLDDYDKRRKEN